MQFLPITSSGARHETWLLEIFASMASHRQHNYLLSPAQKQRLGTEETMLRGKLDAVLKADSSYQAFLRRTLLQLRADKRVADYVCDVAIKQAEAAVRPFRKELQTHVPGGTSQILGGLSLSRALRAGAARTAKVVLSAADVMRSLPPQFEFASRTAEQLDRAGSLLKGFVDCGAAMETERLPLKLALHRAKVDLREALEQMNGRLRQDFDAEFIESLYPVLQRTRSSAADADAEAPLEEEETTDVE